MPEVEMVSELASKRTLIIGGGAAGLACAWRLVRAGAKVTVIDRGGPQKSALWASGGMLAAGFESAVELDLHHPLATPFGRALRAGADLWEDWARTLQETSLEPLGYRRTGTVTPLISEADIGHAALIQRQAEALGVTLKTLSGEAYSELEPVMAKAKGALLFPGDGQLDNRMLGPVLEAAIMRAGGEMVRDCEVTSLVRRGDRVSGVKFRGGETVSADIVVLASGAHAVLDSARNTHMRPVKGQMLAFQLDDHQAPQHVIRAMNLYLAAKPGGKLIVGATVEPDVSDLDTDAGSIDALKARARSLLPALSSVEPVEAWAGLRPASNDSMPIVGELEPGLLMAGGGYRNGVLLAPLLADGVLSLALGEPVCEILAPFGPGRAGLATS